MARLKRNTVRGGRWAESSARRFTGRISLTALGDIFTPSRLAAPGLPHSEPIDLLGSSQQLSGLSGATLGSGAGHLFGPPAVAVGLSSINNISSNPTALGAEGADQRAGFCGTALTDAPPGASLAARSASQHMGAESRAQLPALAGGLSSNNPTSPNLPAHVLFGAEGADQRAGFCGTAPPDALQGASLAARAASQHMGAESRALLPAVADGLSS